MIKIEAPKNPNEMNETFANAFNSGDVENINLLFEKNAKVVKRNGEIISGFDNYNSEHLNLLKLGGKMTAVNKYYVQFENIALLSAEWKIETKNEKGEKIEVNGVSSEIVRRQEDGTWLYVIDNPTSA